MDVGGVNIMATQGTTADLMELLNLIQNDILGHRKKRLVPKGKLLFIFDPPNTHNHAIGIVIDEPVNGGMDANFQK